MYSKSFYLHFFYFFGSEIVIYVVFVHSAVFHAIPGHCHFSHSPVSRTCLNAMFTFGALSYSALLQIIAKHCS